MTDMGFNLTEFSPIPTISDTVPQTLVRSRTTTLFPTSTSRPSGGSRLQSSDPTHRGNVHNSFTGIVGHVEQQNSTGAESGPEMSGTDSTPTFHTTNVFSR